MQGINAQGGGLKVLCKHACMHVAHGVSEGHARYIADLARDPIPGFHLGRGTPLDMYTVQECGAWHGNLFHD